MKLTELFDLAVGREATDIHLATGETPRLRIGGTLVALDIPLDLDEILEPVLTPEANARLGAGLPVGRTIVHGGFAFATILFGVGESGLSVTFRVLTNAIPALDVIAEDALPLFRRPVEAQRGLILIVGTTGSGKWTTACSLTDAINAEQAARILVVEGHPNYRFSSRKGMVTQLHVGQDCDSYPRALEIAAQADVDVVALDDIPTLETLREALILAETGTRVIANLHASTAVEAVDRLLESSGPDAPALRRSLADNLLAVTAQRLLPGKDGQGRVPAYEWIAQTPTIKSALIEGDLGSAQASDHQCRSYKAALETLVATGKVDRP